MTDLLTGGTAVVTGAASDIGRATATAFARDGCKNLALGDLVLSDLEETRDLIKQKYPAVSVEISHLDVSNESNVNEFYKNVVAKFGRVDFAANVAGYDGTPRRGTETSEAEYDKHFNINQIGVFLCERAQLRQMLKQEPLPGFESRGSIVNATSLCATISMPGFSVYSATKSGALGLTKVDAYDFGPNKIRVNSVGPGNMSTSALKSALGEEHIERYTSVTPLGRPGLPEDIANAIVWLSSSRAQFITGITLPVDGGLNLSTGPP